MSRHGWLALSLLLAARGAWAGHSAERQVELRNMVRHDCGSCHGLTLKGGLGPALSPEALAGKPVEYLAAAILHGRPGTPMPPWRAFLTNEESDWVAETLKRGLP